MRSQSVDAIKKLLNAREGDAKQRVAFSGATAVAAAASAQPAPITRRVLCLPVFALGRRRLDGQRLAATSVLEPVAVLREAKDDVAEPPIRDTVAVDPDEAVQERRAKRPRLEGDDDDVDGDGPDVVEGEAPGHRTDSDDDNDNDDDEGEDADQSDGGVTAIPIGIPLPPPVPKPAFTAVDDIADEKKRRARAMRADDVNMIDFSARELELEMALDKKRKHLN